MMPLVAIVGRPNVGKSTLFNRLLGQRRAMVDDQPGVTRDRNYGIVDRFDRPFTLIDTGGFEPVTEDRLLQQMREQSQLAIEEADVILFVMDGREGLTPADREVAALLRTVEKPVFTVVNKVDGEKLEDAAAEFYALGVEQLFTISAEHNRGVNDLVEEVLQAFPAGGTALPAADVPRIAVIGRPNVGKSSLVNRLLGFERSVANPTPGTTRDAVDTLFTWHQQKFLLIDTAGIRRKGRVSQKLEKYSVVDALRSIERADVVLLVVDAEEGITEQDSKIAGYAYEAGRAVVVVVNKWDAVPGKETGTVGRYVETVRNSFKFLAFAPIVFISAKTGQRIHRVMEEVAAVLEQYRRRIGTGDLNRALKEALAAHQPPVVRGRRVKFYYMTQIAVAPPTFVFFCNQPDGIHFSYQRFLTNQLREAFGFSGTPLKLIFRGRD